MASSDNKIINPLERPVSEDINDLQSLSGRFLADVLRSMCSSRDAVTGAATNRSVVLGGLDVQPSGTNVTVAIGVLGQVSATIAPTPGPLDSNFRIARNAAALSVIMPAPGTTTYYLVEAQMLSTTATESRDILNPANGSFVPTVVDKTNTRGLLAQVIAGTPGGSAPTPTGGDWVPLAIVRRPGGGGAVVANDIIDVRPMWSDLMPIANSPRVANNRTRALHRCYVSGTTPANTTTVSCDGIGYLADRPLYANTNGAIDVSTAAFKEPGSAAFAGSTSWHLVLCPWNGLAPKNAQVGAGIATQSGVLVLTQAAFVDGITTVPVQLPAPFAGTSAVGMVVASIRRQSANTGWIVQFDTNGPNSVLYPAIQNFLTMATQTGSPTSVAITTFMPSGVKTILAEGEYSLVGTDTGKPINFSASGAGGTTWGWMVSSLNAPTSFGKVSFAFTIPVTPGTTTVGNSTLFAASNVIGMLSLRGYTF